MQRREASTMTRAQSPSVPYSSRGDALAAAHPRTHSRCEIEPPCSLPLRRAEEEEEEEALPLRHGLGGGWHRARADAPNERDVPALRDHRYRRPSATTGGAGCRGGADSSADGGSSGGGNHRRKRRDHRGAYHLRCELRLLLRNEVHGHLVHSPRLPRQLRVVARGVGRAVAISHPEKGAIDDAEPPPTPLGARRVRVVERVRREICRQAPRVGGKSAGATIRCRGRGRPRVDSAHASGVGRAPDHCLVVRRDRGQTAEHARKATAGASSTAAACARSHRLVRDEDKRRRAHRGPRSRRVRAAWRQLLLLLLARTLRRLARARVGLGLQLRARVGPGLVQDAEQRAAGHLDAVRAQRRHVQAHRLRVQRPQHHVQAGPQRARKRVGRAVSVVEHRAKHRRRAVRERFRVHGATVAVAVMLGRQHQKRPEGAGGKARGEAREDAVGVPRRAEVSKGVWVSKLAESADARARIGRELFCEAKKVDGGVEGVLERGFDRHAQQRPLRQVPHVDARSPVRASEIGLELSTQTHVSCDARL
eukprot:3935144-Rhodomonas_salina.2